MCHSALVAGGGGSSSSSGGGSGLGLFEQSEAESGGLLTHSVFSYDAFELLPSEQLVRFHYSHRDARTCVALERFTTELGLRFPDGDALPQGTTEAAFAVGMVSLAWLWMGLPCRCVRVAAGQLSAEQCVYWEESLNLCLGEFMQRHGLPYPRALHIESDTRERPLSPRRGGVPHAPGAAPGAEPGAAESLPRRVLVPLGGGKDSTTLWELLRGCADTELQWLYLEEEPGEYARNWRLEALARESGTRQPVLLATHNWRCPRWEAARQRRFTPCGHPWAALVAFVSALVARLHGHSAIAVGNERSANEGNGTYMEVVVNHQHDKGLEFERWTAEYLISHVSPDLCYFSGLAHLWEVQIAQLFCSERLRRYHSVFTSCNEAVPETRACARCAKCLFVALLLSAFLEAGPEGAWGVFGDDVLQREDLQPLLEALLGQDGAPKPLECVGTPQEVALCMHRARSAYLRAGRALPFLLRGERATRSAELGLDCQCLLTDTASHAVPPWAQAAVGADPTLACPDWYSFYH